MRKKKNEVFQGKRWLTQVGKTQEAVVHAPFFVEKVFSLFLRGLQMLF